jgi:hypothetical protein
VKIKVKCHHFDTIEAIKAELQAVLNTLTEHDFQSTLKNRSSGHGAYTQKGTTGLLRGWWWPIGPWQHWSPKLWIPPTKWYQSFADGTVTSPMMFDRWSNVPTATWYWLCRTYSKNIELAEEHGWTKFKQIGCNENIPLIH